MNTLGQPIPLRLLIDEAIKHARRHFRSLYLPVAVPMALLAAAMPLVQTPWLRDMNTAQSQGGSPTLAISSFAGIMVVSLVFLLAYSLGNTALLIASMDALTGVPVSMARAWRTTFTPRVLGTVLLVLLLVAAGFVCCVLPGIYVGVVLCLVVPVMAVESRFGTGALSRSHQLITYNPQRDVGADPRLKAFLVLFVGWLLEYVVGLVVGLPVIIVQQYLTFAASRRERAWTQWRSWTR